jgi:acyl-CoA thioesterase
MSLFSLQPDGPANRYALAVTDDLCVGTAQLRFLFGGIALGVAVAALERAARRPLICATAQFLSQTPPDARLEIDIAMPTIGRFNTQAQAIARIRDRVTFQVTAALGERPGQTSMQGPVAPAVPAPEDCRQDYAWLNTATSLQRQIEARHVQCAGATPGRMLLWLRTRADLTLDSALLAIFADFTTAVVTDTLGLGFVGNSLDNTLRICRIVPSRWVLCDIGLDAAHAGFAHGDMRMFAQTGELLAVASQSMIVRAIA